METLSNRKELLDFWKKEGNPFMWEDIKKFAKLECINSLDDLRCFLTKLKNKRKRLTRV